MKSQMIIRSIRPVILFLSAIVYFLGGGIAHYFGARISWVSFSLGLLITLLLLAAFFLLERFYFFSSSSPENLNNVSQLNIKNLTIILQTSLAIFTFSGLLSIILISFSWMTWQAGVLLLIGIALLILYAVPPMSLSSRGYGEIILAILLGTILPAFSFLLHEPFFHRLLTLITFPLTLLAIACLLALNFSTYASDVSLNRVSFLRRLTWQFAIPIHHVLLLFAYLLFALIPIFGISWALIWPLFLASPFTIIQILWLRRIGKGGTPLWKFYSLLVPTVFGLHTYLLAVAIWMR